MLDQMLEKHSTPKRTHLDVACGTGMVVDYFRRLGWKSTGIDASFAMLQMARRRTARIAAGDFRALPVRGRFARITCLYDSLNHMMEPAELTAAFASMRAVMDSDSLLFFDVNHPEIYPVVWGLAEPFVAKSKDYHLEIATTYRAREKTGHAMVTGWAKMGGERVEIHEQHLQRAYTEREIARSLGSAGLAPVDVIDFDPYGEGDAVDAPTVKLFYVCRPV